ncbi:MAG: hypothetical protein H6707_15315 [Deltaproteobacteria bacterium]|nr:hypothetical protein [Deltaproteobacteria bacterium]
MSATIEKFAGVALVVALLAPTPLLAQNLRGLPMGAHSAALGQAGVAGDADDGSAYLNPAALASLTEDRVSLSTTVFSRGYYDIELAGYLPGWTERDRALTLADAVYAPTSFSYGRAWGKAVRTAAALSFIVPVYESFSVNQQNAYDDPQSDRYTLTGFSRRNTFKRLLFGPSIALGVPRLGLRFGASFFFAVSEMSWHSLLAWSLNSPTSGLSQMRYKEVHEFRRSVASSGVIGLQWSPLSALTLGLSAKGSLFRLSGSGTVRVVERELLDDNKGTIISEGDISAVDLPDPFELRFGLSYRVGSRFELRADVLFTLFPSDPLIGNYQMTYSRFRAGVAPSTDATSWEQTMATRNVVNVSLGAAIQLSERWALNLGALTDRSSSADRDAVEGWLDRARWPQQDRYFGTLGGSFRGKNLSLHAGIALGASVYRSNEFFSTGSDDQRAAPVLRLFFAGGFSPENLIRSAF